MKTKRDPGKKTTTDQGRKTRTDPGKRPGQTSRRSELSQVRSPGWFQVTKRRKPRYSRAGQIFVRKQGQLDPFQVELTNYCYSANLFLLQIVS